MKRIGITIGDINGIGPEVALKAVYKHPWSKDVKFIFIGPKELIVKQALELGFSNPAAPATPASQQCRVWNTGDKNMVLHLGEIHTEASVAAADAIEMAVSHCLQGSLDAMVTAPICKEGFHRAKILVPGHTEYLAKLTHTKTFGMMLIGGGLRVMLVTRHIPLADVPAALTEKNIYEAIELAGQALKRFGIPNGKIGVCGLNPHAGDGGIMGKEEINLIQPAICAAREKGFNVSDVVPADTIFYEALRGDYDAVVAMYHDQGLGPLKMVGFDEGINVTLGLPIIRTSPDHGTAFNLAGKNRASEKSMKNAIDLALKMTES